MSAPRPTSNPGTLFTSSPYIESIFVFSFYSSSFLTKWNYFSRQVIGNIFVEYNQQDATFHNLFISVRRSTCFRWVFRPSAARNCTYSVRYWSDKIPDAVCAVLSCWWWTENPSETCRASYRNKEIVNVASCWLYSAKILALHGIMNVNFIGKTLSAWLLGP